MKKILLSIPLLGVLIGCSLEGEDLSVVYTECIIDSCEYVAISGFTEPTHKGNCKFCERRDSLKWERRKSEIKEIIKNICYDKD